MIKDYNKTAIIAGDKEISYTELLQRITMFGDVTPRNEERTNVNDVLTAKKVIIFAENREAWIYAFFSVWQNHVIAVPVDASSTVDDLAYIINDCQPTAIWTSRSHEEVVRNAISQTGSHMDVLLMDDYESAPLPATVSDDHAAKIARFGEEELSGDGVALIVYTSGTTGSPKGVMLSFSNIASNIRGVADDVKIFHQDSTTIILLPLHHILPLVGTVIIPVTRGCGVAICPSMSGPDIMSTLCRGKIRIFIGVPRLWQTLYTGIKKKVDASIVTRTLFNICKSIGNRSLSRFVFQSVRKKMGGHIEYCVSGGAALDREIGEGLRTLGIDVLEGYGMTETAPIIAFTRPGDIIPGCVGLPLPSVECKLVNDELCAKGDNVMLGYYNRPEETAAVIDADGFVHTGDLARFDESGRIIITGRSKEIIVLSNGKNVQPAEIEFKLEKYDDKVKEAAVTQDGDMLHAIIVPQDAWSQSHNNDNAKLEEQLKREVIEPYNRSVENYKKLMKITIFHGELPRTKLDKLQRFKLKEIINPLTVKKTEDKKAKNNNLGDIKGAEEFTIIADYIMSEKKVDVKPGSHIETDLALDSLDKVGLQGFIEQTFGVTINADKMAEFNNILLMAQHIASTKTRMDVEDVDWHSLIAEQSTTLTLPTADFTHRLFEKGFTSFFRLYNRMSVKGKENIPTKGPFILAPNHQSYLDAPIAMAGVPAKLFGDCYFYATEEHVNSPFLRYMARHHNIVIMERRNLKNSILKLAQVLKQGKNVMIFPEGTRTHTGSTNNFKKMFAILAKELDVPVVPVCIDGAFKMLKRGTRVIQPCKINVTYLPAVSPTDKTYDEITDEVKLAIDNKLKKS